MKIPTFIKLQEGGFELPYQPWFDSKDAAGKPDFVFKETECCAWIHLNDGFTLRYSKSGNRLRVYHKDWDKTNGPIEDAFDAKLPDDQDSFDQLLRDCLEAVQFFKP